LKKAEMDCSIDISPSGPRVKTTASAERSTGKGGCGP